MADLAEVLREKGVGSGVSISGGIDLGSKPATVSLPSAGINVGRVSPLEIGDIGVDPKKKKKDPYISGGQVTQAVEDYFKDIIDGTDRNDPVAVSAASNKIETAINDLALSDSTYNVTVPSTTVAPEGASSQFTSLFGAPDSGGIGFQGVEKAEFNPVTVDAVSGRGVVGPDIGSGDVTSANVAFTGSGSPAMGYAALGAAKASARGASVADIAENLATNVAVNYFGPNAAAAYNAYTLGSNWDNILSSTASIPGNIARGNIPGAIGAAGIAANALSMGKSIADQVSKYDNFSSFINSSINSVVDSFRATGEFLNNPVENTVSMVSSAVDAFGHHVQWGRGADKAYSIDLHDGKDVFNFVVNAKNEIVTPGVVGIIGGIAPYVGTVFSIAQQVLGQSGHFSRLGQEYVDFANAAQMPSVNRGKSTIYSTAYLSSEDPNNAKSFISMDLEDLGLHDMISMQMNLSVFSNEMDKAVAARGVKSWQDLSRPDWEFAATKASLDPNLSLEYYFSEEGRDRNTAIVSQLIDTLTKPMVDETLGIARDANYQTLSALDPAFDELFGIEGYGSTPAATAYGMSFGGLGGDYVQGFGGGKAVLGFSDALGTAINRTHNEFMFDAFKESGLVDFFSRQAEVRSILNEQLTGREDRPDWEFTTPEGVIGVMGADGKASVAGYESFSAWHSAMSRGPGLPDVQTTANQLQEQAKTDALGASLGYGKGYDLSSEGLGYGWSGGDEGGGDAGGGDEGGWGDF